MGVGEPKLPIRPHGADASGFHPPRCVRCFHTLVGLPERGACPECGTAFDGPSRWAWVRKVSEPQGRSLAMHFLPLGLALAVLAVAAILVADRENEGLGVSVAIWTAALLFPVTMIHSTVRSFLRISALHRIRVEDGVATPRDALWRWIVPPVVGLTTTLLVFMTWTACCVGCFVPRIDW